MSKRKLIAFRLIFGLSTLVILLVFFDLRKIGAALRAADPTFVVASFAACWLAVLFRAFRWMLIVRDVGVRIPFARLVKVYVISYWFNIFLPGSVGGDAYKVYGASRSDATALEALTTVFVERITGVLALLTVGIAAALALRDALPIPAYVIVLAAAAVAVGVLACWCLLRLFRRFYDFAAKRVKAIARIVPEQKADETSEFLARASRNFGMIVKAYVMGLALQVLVLYAYYLIGAAIDGNVLFAYFLVFFPLVEIGSMIPVSVNGIGIKEALMVFLLGIMEVEPAFSLSLALLYRGYLIVFAVAGGLLLMTEKRQSPLT